MKKYLFGMVALMALALTACSYDDSELWDKVNDLDNRVKTLEGLCREMNTNIESLETILESLNENEHVSNIAPITEDGKVVGYTITFTSGESVTIYNNEAGGTTPSLGVAKDEDGLYYWTLDGEWLLDNAGNKVKAEGTDGLTPRLKVEGGYWYVSYDNGATWVEAGAATTEGSGDNLFKEVSYDDEYVYLTLADGTVLVLPRTKVETPELTLALSTADIEVGETLEIEYTILPEDADNKTITWSTSNAEVATVSAEGVVSGLARGSATITAELGTLKASCEVNVWSVADQVIESSFLDIRYWGDYYNTGYDNFTVSFGTVEFADMNISSTGDFFQLSANTTKFTNIAAAYLYPGVYTFDEESPYEEMTITGRKQSLRIRYSDDTNNDGAMEELYNYMLDAYMVIEYDEVEEVCIFVAEVKLDTEEVIRIHYRGSVYFTNLLELLIPDQITEDLDFVCEYATSSHMGDGVYLIDMQETEDGWIDTQMITMKLTTEPNDDSIKAGVYPISAEPVDGGYMSNGYYVTSPGSTYYQGSYAYILRSDYSMSYAFIDEGTLTISYEGDNITVELEAKDLGGYRVHTKYSGPQILQKYE